MSYDLSNPTGPSDYVLVATRKSSKIVSRAVQDIDRHRQKIKSDGQIERATPTEDVDQAANTKNAGFGRNVIKYGGGKFGAGDNAHIQRTSYARPDFGNKKVHEPQTTACTSGEVQEVMTLTLGESVKYKTVCVPEKRVGILADDGDIVQQSF